jgi:hypothetical protein
VKTLQTRVLLLATSGSGKSVKLMELVAHGIFHKYQFLVGDHLTQWHRRDWPKRYVRIERTGNLEKLCQMACRMSPVIVVFDEIDTKIPANRPIEPDSALYEVLHCGRNPRPPGVDDVRWWHWGPVGLWGTARFPSNLRTDWKNLADRVYLGLTHGEPSHKWIGGILHGGVKEARKLATHEKGEWIYRDLT